MVTMGEYRRGLGLDHTLDSPGESLADCCERRAREIRAEADAMVKAIPDDIDDTARMVLFGKVSSERGAARALEEVAAYERSQGR